jgi:RNA polymerase sigma-70 factor (ECF subfamily)
MAFTGLARETDEELIEAVKAGDTSAFGVLAERHRRTLVAFFARYSWDRQFAEDCAQEVFVKLFVYLARYQPQAKFTTFLHRVARNHWIDKLRSRRAAPRPVSFDTGVGGEDDRGVVESLAGIAPGPDEILSGQELREHLRRAIRSLPPAQRAVVRLAALGGQTYDEIADLLDIPVGTVKSRMHTAVGRMRALMAVGA